MLDGRVLITGGAGFLARAIYRRAALEGWPAEFTCLSRDDAKHAALQVRYPEVDCVLGDVAGMSVESMGHLFRGYDLVIHAAAQKYVDRSEHHAWDTVRVNIEGSRNVAMAAMYARVPKVIGISTDKACLPVNTYGLSKATMERLLQEATEMSPVTEFVLCRYGNVIGSTGSVIPLFMNWAQAGEPIRLTNPEMTRFWMAPDEAVATILWAVEHGRPGHITIPRMRSMDMASLAWMAADTRPDLEGSLTYLEHVGNGHIEIVGPRPGEKVHEQIVAPHEMPRTRWWDGGAARPIPFAEIEPPTSRPDPMLLYGIDRATSDHPSGGAMSRDDMLAIVRDAATI